MQCVLDLMFPHTLGHENALKPSHTQDKSLLFTNSNKAVLSIAHHSRETQMALTRSASLVNWGITGVSAHPISSIITCEFIWTNGSLPEVIL